MIDSCVISLELVECAIEHSLSQSLAKAEVSKSDAFNITTTIKWDSTEIESLMDENLLMNYLKTINQDNCLKILLACINKHINQSFTRNVSFNGLKVHKSSDRSVRVLISNVNDETNPLSILHIGKDRGVSLIPKKCISTIGRMETLMFMTFLLET